MMQFQSTRPRGARRAISDELAARASFQSTRPRGARLTSARCASALSQGFNPRARAGRDRRVRGRMVGRRDVSIHAPARGATRMPVRLLEAQSTCFNPRARAGRDAAGANSAIGGSRFNPRARAGRDAGAANIAAAGQAFQSTRPRGARPRTPVPRAYPQCCFNPRARAGRDELLRAPASGAEFQSTRPRGARLCRDRESVKMRRVSIHAPARGATRRPGRQRSGVGFNPRARAGRDVSSPLARRSRSVSIHAPARGATGVASCSQAAIAVSIHAPARGATDARGMSRISAVSIHAPARGATSGRHRALRGFNPRARAGRDALQMRERSPPIVSIHAPARGATMWSGP